MAKKPEYVQVRVYKKDHSKLRKLAFLNGTTFADIINELAKR